MLSKTYSQGQKWIFKHHFLAFLSSYKLTLNGNETGNIHKQFFCCSFSLVSAAEPCLSSLISDRQTASQTKEYNQGFTASSYSPKHDLLFDPLHLGRCANLRPTAEYTSAFAGKGPEKYFHYQKHKCTLTFFFSTY